MARAFYEALTMDRAERAEALEATREAIRRNTIFRWAHDQLIDLLPSTAVRRPGTITLMPAASEPVVTESEVST
jgi:trehalose-6-phosphate synthase